MMPAASLGGMGTDVREVDVECDERALLGTADGRDLVVRLVTEVRPSRPQLADGERFEQVSDRPDLDPVRSA